jgi:PadR family transcriptional regulator, regulatory protein AphA
MSLQYGILGLLSYAPMNGYNLKKLFGKSINYIWTASLSQIYRELGSLEGKGFVSSTIQQQDDRPDKRIYSITEEGKKAFLEWLRDFPAVLAAPKRDEFMLRVFFGSKLSRAELISQFERFAEEKKIADVAMTEDRKIIDATAKDIKKNFAMMSDEKDGLLWRMITKRAVMTNHLLIQWAEECIKELQNSDIMDENQEGKHGQSN